MAKAKRPFTVVLDSRNRELKYVWPGNNVHEAIQELKKNGKQPTRTIVKMK